MKIVTRISIIVFILLVLHNLSSDAASIITKIQSFDDDINDVKNTLASIEEGSSKNYEIGQEFVPKIRRKFEFLFFLDPKIGCYK